ncbi:hypothetical protein F5884DRAFT_266869 [Xylogone sp. PMI_703]|nr:hypothetical protein F5884DRAFT_266869 [Xylogone sp. PMI_703]
MDSSTPLQGRWSGIYTLARPSVPGRQEYNPILGEPSSWPDNPEMNLRSEGLSSNEAIERQLQLQLKASAAQARNRRISDSEVMLSDAPGSDEGASSPPRTSPNDEGQRTGNNEERGPGGRIIRRRMPRLNSKEKKKAIRICIRESEVYRHVKIKKKFWDHVTDLFQKEAGIAHASLSKTIQMWTRNRRKEIANGSPPGVGSGFTRLLDEWIACLDIIENEEREQDRLAEQANGEGSDMRPLQENIAGRSFNAEASVGLDAEHNGNVTSLMDDTVEANSPSSTSSSSIGGASPFQGLERQARIQAISTETPILCRVAQGLEDLAKALRHQAARERQQADIQNINLVRRLEGVEEGQRQILSILKEMKRGRYF